jgi:hypothetical protein
MRTTISLIVLFGFAAQSCRCEEQPTTLLGRLFGRFISGVTVSVLPVEDEAPPQELPTTPSENMQFLGCTQSTACYNDSTQTPGAWTCRPQLVGQVSVCIPTLLGVTLGREGDTCGCCDGICPKKCECGCITASGLEGVMTRFNLMFGLIQFEQCLEPTVADAATSFSTLDISCSEECS